MDIILLVLHVVLSLGIITLVLLQKGAGASAGAAFGGGGGGGAGSVFGASGSANFLSKTTAIFATAFFVNSLALAYLAANQEVPSDSVLDNLTVPVEMPADTIPAADGDIGAGESAMPMQLTDDVPVADDVPAADSPDDMPPPAGE